MKILLQAEGYVPELGGGHTLSQDVLQAFVDRADNYDHEFFIIDDGSEACVDRELPRNFSRLAIERSLPRRLLERLRFEGRRRLPLTRRRLDEDLAAPYHNSVNEALVRHGVECALSLVPSAWSTILPAIVQVWDVGHRTHGYFPELFADRQWEGRERHYREVLPRAIAVITGTALLKSQVERFYNLSPEVVKVVSFPTPSFASEAATKPATGKLPPGISPEYIFYPAQYWPHKNHFRLLHALKILRDSHGWEGALVCCGSDKGNLQFIRQQARALGIQDRVHLLGFVDRDTLLALYRNAMAMTFASYLGPDNLPPLEAFALGCPVVMSGIDGAAEFGGDAAIYVDPDSAGEFANAVWRVRNEPGLRERLVDAGRARALQSTPADYADALVGIVDSFEPKFKCFR